MQYLYSYTYNELLEIFSQTHWPKFRIMQIIDGLYKSKAIEFEHISTLPKEIKEYLKMHFRFFSIKEKQVQKSMKTDTTKFLFQLEDEHGIETVVLPNTKHQFTLCVSTQVGCALACAFCASGSKGFIRDLTPYEMVEQVMYIRKKGFSITNIVFMGIGEPLLNYDNVIKAVQIINDQNLINIGARKITLSTAGVIEGINKLSDFDMQIKLSVSLHFVNDDIRSQYMPLNKKYPLPQLIHALEEYQKKMDRLITFEYILFQNINDDLKTAEALIQLLKRLNYKINLITYNSTSSSDFKSPDEITIRRFEEYLLNRGIKVTLRQRLGDDIKAACGQLRLDVQTS